MKPDFKKINIDFESYSKKVIIKTIIVSIILVIFAFIILFIKLLSFNFAIQNENIQKNSQIINYQIDFISKHVVSLKNSFLSFKHLDSHYKYNQHFSHKDAFNRYVYNSPNIGTFISLYSPMTSFLDEFSALEHLSVMIKNFQKIDYVLWTYYYSKNKFVYVHPFIENPLTYKFSEKSYSGDILENTVTTNKPYISTIYDDLITKKKVFALTVPIFKERIFQGTFALDIDLEKLFQSVAKLNVNNKHINLFLVDRKNQHYSLENRDRNTDWFVYSEHSKIKLGYNYKNFHVYNTQKIVDGIVLVSTFSIIDILKNSLLDPNLIYFVFVLVLFYLFIFFFYYRYIKPQHAILIGVLEYLDSRKDTKESKMNAITKEVYRVFKYLVSEFSVKIKIDNDIRHSKETIEYFIKSSHIEKNFGYMINPAFNFSGDYVRIFDLENELKIFFVADVSGKGVGAMILVNHIDIFFNFNLKSIHSLESFENILNEFNKYMVIKNINCNFISFKAIAVCNKRNEISIINAGAPNLFYTDYNSIVHEIKSTDSFTPIGINSTEEYKFSRLQVTNKIKFLISTTDGILEQKNKTGIFYQNSFLDALRFSMSLQSIDEMIKFIWQDFFSFIENYENQYDDFTLLMIRVEE
ncbi:SpoIIE family protein phosphatase [Pigmentibacter ruber]